jgi:hypothetical protein
MWDKAEDLFGTGILTVASNLPNFVTYFIPWYYTLSFIRNLVCVS